MPVKSVAEIFEIPQSSYFYASASGQTGHGRSYYAARPRGFIRSEEEQFERESSLCFDVSNQYLQASVDIEGTIQEVRSARSLKPYNGDLRGVFVQKQLIDGGPWKFEIEMEDRAETSLKQTPEKKESRTGLLANLFPLTSFYYSTLRCRMVTFAPVSKGISHALPVVIQVLLLSNAGEQTVAGKISLPACFSQWVEASFALDEREQSALYLLEKVNPEAGSIAFRLKPGGEQTVAAAFMVAGTGAELREIRAVLAQKSLLEWFNDTLSFHQNRLGSLTTADPYYGESLVRMEELCRQSLLYLPDGACAGGTLGSNVNPNPEGWGNTNVWMKDNFYAALPMSLFNPELCEKAILFYMKWGVPRKTWGRGVQRYPNADPLTQSLSNSLDSIALATAYYQATGNKRFFLEHPELLSFAKDLLERVRASRQQEDIHLFPSMYVSDGDARGDFHTGSNLVAWYCFDGMARLCHEVYDDEQLARQYRITADKIHKDIVTTCKGSGVLGEQFFEGAWRDGSFVPCHDGEESDVTLMPFYRFTTADDPALTRFSRLAFTPYNPFYKKGADGVAWFDAGWGCDSTFPGFTTAIAGAENESELLDALERIRRLTDLDGSIWWWPHRLGCTDPSQVVRWLVKSCWAAGIYTLKFVHDVLGIEVDTPAHRVKLSPFVPWDSFKWEDCCLGNAVFDFSFEKSGQGIRATITNKNPGAFEAAIELVLPAGAQPASYQINEEPYSMDLVRLRMRYGRPCYGAMMKLEPGKTLNFEVRK